MANGVPVRLSEALTVRARAASQVLDRSLTEQVEHWARLGQVVEAVIGSATVHQLKSRSFDPDLRERLAFASTSDGRAMAAKLIRERNPGLANGGIELANGHAKPAKRSVAAPLANGHADRKRSAPLANGHVKSKRSKSR